MSVKKECMLDKDMTGGNTQNTPVSVDSTLPSGVVDPTSQPSQETFAPVVPSSGLFTPGLTPGKSSPKSGSPKGVVSDKDGQGRLSTYNYNYSNKGAHFAHNQYGFSNNGFSKDVNAIDMNKDGVKISSDQSTYSTSGYNNKYHADIYQPGVRTHVDQQSSLNSGGYNSSTQVRKDGIFGSSNNHYSNKVDKSGFSAKGSESSTFCCLFTVNRTASLNLGSNTSASQNIECCGSNLGCSCNICAGDCSCSCCGLIGCLGDCLGSCLKGIGSCICGIPDCCGDCCNKAGDCCNKVGDCCNATRDCLAPAAECMGEVISCVSKCKC